MLGVGAGFAHSDLPDAKPSQGSASDAANVEAQAEGDGAHGADPHGADGHAVDYNKPPLDVNVSLFIFSLVLFGAFVLVMKSMAWEPLIAGLDAREARVVNAESDARALKIEVEQLTAKAEQRLAEVQNEVKAILAQARADAEAKRMEIVAQAEAEAQRVKQEALASIAKARSEALAELEQTVDQQVALATEHVAGRRI